MINEWLLNMNYDKIVGRVTLDFKKAFDVHFCTFSLKVITILHCIEIYIIFYFSLILFMNMIE